MSSLIQHPAPGGHTIRFRGDTARFRLENRTGKRGRAWLRTNIGQARVRHAEIIAHAERGLVPLSRDWHDFPMEADGSVSFAIALPLLEVGRFEAKAYFVEDEGGRIHWPEGGNAVLKVEPAETCAGNTIYTAFVRQFGEARHRGAVAPQEADAVGRLDAAGYAVIPRSGTFRDLARQLDFIVGALRCKIVQLLPIHPAPTTYARMGRFGSPFAVLDLLDADPALAEFDKRTTPLDQFEELVDETHRRNARLYLDMPINHTGWASHLQVHHPGWFHHNEDGTFMSPGAWGVTWEDLSKLDYAHRGLWRYMADVFLFWCRRGVDGFRCDAGYKVPFEAWEYIVAKVRMEYPDTVFLLEGLGGYKHVTERLLADAGMNWAYSEIFQNHDQGQVDGYLPESLRVAESKGNLVHFCETHDNARLAATSHAFARLRAAFCALTAHNGAFGFANGVEWHATEKIDVHNAPSLNWDAEDNMVDWLRRLHAIMETHPAFHAGATVELATDGHHNAAAVLRTDASGDHRLLVLANLDHGREGAVRWHGRHDAFATDLLTGRTVRHADGLCPLQPGEVLCLSDNPAWIDRIGETLDAPFDGAAESRRQGLQAKAMEIYSRFEAMDRFDASRFTEDPKALCEELAGGMPVVATWQWPRDTRRTVMLAPGQFLLVRAGARFIAELKDGEGRTLAHEKSLPQAGNGCFALFTPLETPSSHRHLALKLAVFEPEGTRRAESPVLQLCTLDDAKVATSFPAGETHDRDRYAICTNRHGALAQVRVGWAELRSKYDGLLCANLDPAVPVDRHTLLTRCRAWVVRKGYSIELSLHCQTRFAVADDGAVRWDFAVPVGEGWLVPLSATLRMHPDADAIELAFRRGGSDDHPEHLANETPVTLIVRADIEDRCSHHVTKAYAGPEAQWPAAIRPEADGFGFEPAPGRRLDARLEGGTFHPEPEWYYMIGHPVDQARGIDGSSDLFSPGFFRTGLAGNETARLVAAANGIPAFAPREAGAGGGELAVDEAMRLAMRQFIVKRDAFQTVIAGYPWFLDWGRDTLICLRGIIAAGLLDEAEKILLQFARFERGGTLPNMIRGTDDRNRETSDAPLWFYVACADLMRARGGRQVLEADCGGRTLQQVLVSLAEGIIHGTENGIRLDRDSGLVFSPAHFTWMDTNYPAGTPRQGYPIEIQALWHHALVLLDAIDGAPAWKRLAAQAAQSIGELFVVRDEEFTYLADCLAAAPGTGARAAAVDDALRPNQLLAITLGAVADPALCRNVLSACGPLLVPGAIRSLADRPVRRPSPIHHGGRLLNDPSNPYWGHYTGDEDTRRKPAYHNGTAWSWIFPSYAEALAAVYGAPARAIALALLGSASEAINQGCLRHVPEVADGNTPHAQRGCGAQAWGATELYRAIARLKG